MFAVILVYSTSYALRIEKVLQQTGLETKLIPVPRHLSSDCGVCVRIPLAEQARAKQLLAENQCEFAAIHAL